MVQKILVPLDGSQHAHKALGFALDIAEKHGAAVVLLHVLLRNLDLEQLRALFAHQDLSADLQATLERAAREKAPPLAVAAGYARATVPQKVLEEVGREILAGAERTAQARGLPRVECLLEDGDPAKCIIACAERLHADTIVMASRGLGTIEDLFLGSVSRKVNHRARGTCILVK